MTPKCLALVPCRKFGDDESGFPTLHGTFDHIVAQTFPARLHFALYAVLSGVTAPTEFTVVFRHLGADGTEEVAAVARQLVAPRKGPITDVQLLIEIPDMVFGAPGLHFVRLMSEGMVLGERRISVEKQ